MLKSLANKLLRPLAITLVSDWESPSTKIAEMSYSQRHLHWLKELGVTVCIDIGANTGQYGRYLIDVGYEGKIVSFEPLSLAFSQLEGATKSCENWTAKNLAISDIDGQLEINIAGNSQSSSLLQMKKRHRDAEPQSAYIDREVVAVAKLSTIWNRITDPADFVWIKIDTQGSERMVLNGLGRIPAQVVAVELELSLSDLYDGQPSLPDLTQYLLDEGFEMVALEEVFREPVSHRTLQVNGIFLRRYD